MNADDTSHRTDRPLQANAYAIHRAVVAIRKARGKLNPEDCMLNPIEHEAVVADFLTDLYAAMEHYLGD